MNSMIRTSIICTLFVYLNFAGFVSTSEASTCSPNPAPAAASCSGGNGVLTNNTSVNVNQTYWYSGSGNVSNVTLNGGTVRVCGNLAISGFNFNKGSLAIEASGSLSLLGSNFNFNANSSLVNRGYLNITGDLALQGSGLKLWNAGPVAMMNVTGYIHINSASSKIINQGYITSAELRIQSNAAGAVCIETDSCFQVNGNIYNDNQNGVDFRGTSGLPGVISYTGDANLNRPFSNDTGVKVCQQPGATQSGSSNWCSATVVPNCSGCSSTLPIELVAFTVDCHDDQFNFNWTTASETNNERYDLQMSNDGYTWETLKSIPGAGNSNNYLNYNETIDAGELRRILGGVATFYARILQTDFDGTFDSYDIVAVNNCSEKAEIKIYPTITTGNLTLESEYEITRISLVSELGQLVKTIQFEKPRKILTQDFTHLSTGTYYLRIESGAEIQTKRFQKQ